MTDDEQQQVASIDGAGELFRHEDKRTVVLPVDVAILESIVEELKLAGRSAGWIGSLADTEEATKSLVTAELVNVIISDSTR